MLSSLAAVAVAEEQSEGVARAPALAARDVVPAGGRGGRIRYEACASDDDGEGDDVGGGEDEEEDAAARRAGASIALTAWSSEPAHTSAHLISVHRASNATPMSSPPGLERRRALDQ